jgi:hypothetical protein
VESHLPAEKEESPARQQRVRLGLVLGPESGRRPEPEWRGKGVVWLGLRVVVLPKQAVEA